MGITVYRVTTKVKAVKIAAAARSRGFTPTTSQREGRIALQYIPGALSVEEAGARGRPCPQRRGDYRSPKEIHSIPTHDALRTSSASSQGGGAMRRYAGLFAVILVAVALVAAGCQRQQAQQPAPAPQPAAQVPDLGGKTIRVATDATYPPFELLDKDKNIIGYDIDLITEICKLANCQADIKRRPG